MQPRSLPGWNPYWELTVILRQCTYSVGAVFPRRRWCLTIR
jgi:hypothetical protein